MAATVLNSPRAVQMSIFVVRAFVGFRRMIQSHAELTKKLDELEEESDDQFEVVFEAIERAHDADDGKAEADRVPAHA